MRRICVIANPASGRGRGSRMLERVRAALETRAVSLPVELHATRAAGEERALVENAIARGCDTIVALGGDGTWSNVGNAILASGAAAGVRLALLAAGTGNDFAKSVGAPVHDIARTLELAAEGPDVAVDVGRIENRYFLNVAGFGVDVAVLENLGRVRWLTGNALYFYAGLREVFGYPGLDVEIESGDGSGARIGGRQLIVIIANARNFAGVFRIAPAASTVDGVLDAIAIRNAPPLRRLRLFIAATRGGHVTAPEVATPTARQFTLRFASPPAYETDGEYNVADSRELVVSCVPRALRLVTPLSEAALAGDGSIEPAERPPAEASR